MKSTNLHSATKKFELLIDIINRPGDYLDAVELRNALTTQSKFSLYSDVSLDITGCHLNTFKQATNAVVPGGFKAMEHNRIKAAAVLTEKIPPKERTDTVRSLKSKVDELKHNIRSLEAHIMRLTYLQRKTMEKYKRISDLPPNQIKLAFEKDLDELYSLMRVLDISDFWTTK
ncbi:hypothetical protein ACIQAL_03800 [Pseudomonas sp. NPDC088368]|uniref:hypothetical protein n=1 Tax=Pseudomonas sp. NPDC088368 TaxID=3364453 RepID=UPI003826080C